jgi:hypothetical protein
MRKLGIVSVAELVRIADRIEPQRADASNEASAQISRRAVSELNASSEVFSPLEVLETAHRLLESLADPDMRGSRHLRAALRQITKAIEMNKRQA